MTTTTTIDFGEPLPTKPTKEAPPIVAATSPEEQVRILVTADRMDSMPMRMLEHAKEASVSWMMNYIAFFLADGRGVYLPKEEAMEIVRDMTQGEAHRAGDVIMARTEEIGAPKK